MQQLQRSLALALVTLLLPACDDNGSSETSKSAAAEDATKDAKDQAKEEAKDAKTPKKNEDRGNATVNIDGTKWTAERCSARPRNGTLKLSCSTTSMADGKVDRQALDITLSDYKGTGTYKATQANFTGVGFDGKKAAAADDADKAAKDALVDATKSATVHLLSDVSVEVTKDDGLYVDGTFSAPAGDLMKTPAFEDGRFRAVVKNPKK